MKSITFRLIFWYALATTTVASVFMVIGYFALERNFIAGLDELNDVEFEEIRPRLGRLGDDAPPAAVVEAISKHAELDASLYYFQVGRSHGDVIYRSSNMRGATLPAAVHQAQRTTVSSAELGTLRVGEYSAGAFDVHIASSMFGLNSLKAKLLRVALLLMAGVLLFSVAIGYAISRLALNPIAKIERAAKRISINNLGERIEVSDTGDEISQLAKLLNQMFDRLQAAFSQAQRFAADASHELKTPLSLLHLRSEHLLRNETDMSKAIREELRGQLEDIESLSRVIEQLLILSKAEAGALTLDLQERLVGPFLQEFEQDARALAEDQGLVFQLEGRYDGRACFDETWLRHSLFNLLSNSLKFAPIGSRIELESRLEGEQWILDFKDEGPGVDASKLSRVFDRFFTTNTERRNDHGSGLGLALVKGIVQQGGGNVEASNRSERSGFRVVISMPRFCHRP